MLGIIALLFGVLNLPSIQESIKIRVENELKNKLETELSIGKLHFQPFNTIELNDILLDDKSNERILTAEKLYAQIDLVPLLRKEVVITTVHLNDFTINLSKENKDSTLNIQFIIDAFKSDSKTPKTSFEVKINSLNINQGNFNFDIKDQPEQKNGQFDKNHIAVSDFNANLALKSVKEDSLNIQIKRLSLKEQSGVEIKNLITRVISQNNLIQIKGFNLELPHSKLELDKCNIDTSPLKDDESIENIAVVCSIASSHITPKDISAFVPVFKNFSDRIFFKGQIEGTLKELDIASLKLDYGDKMTLLASARLKNILQKDSLHISGGVHKLQITTDGIKSLVDNFTGKDVVLPKEVYNAGTITFGGDISGYLNRLNAHGTLLSQLGNIKSDLQFGFNTVSGLESFFTGKISTEDFNLGDLTQYKDLDKLSFNLSVDIKKQKDKNMSGTVIGDVYHFDYKGYTYNNINLNARYNGLKLEGEAKIEDENIFLDVDGVFDLSKKQPEMIFSAKLENLKVDKLHLTDKYNNSYLSLNMEANFKGDHIDNLEGFIHVDSVVFYKDSEKLTVNQFKLSASGKSNDKTLEIHSDIINGKITGAYSFSTIIASFKETMSTYLPALISTDQPKGTKFKTTNENNLFVDFTIGNTEQISRMLSLPFTAYSDIKIAGFYNNINQRFQLEIFYPSAKIAGTNIKSGYFLIENNEQNIKSTINGVLTGKNNIQNDVQVNIKAENDVIDTRLQFSNDSKHKFGGIFSASAQFTKNTNTKQLYTNINIKPSEIALNDTVWQIGKADVLIHPDYIAVNNIDIHNSVKDQFINITGKYVPKENSDESLRINLRNINLDYVFNTLAIDALNFGGYASGTLQAIAVDGNPYVKAKLNIKDFAFNKTLLGDLVLNSELDDQNKRIKLLGEITNPENNITNIDGYINPQTQELSIDFDAHQIDIAFLNKYTSSLFNNIKGKGSGNVQLFGNFSDVTVAGKAYIEGGSLGINFLNTTYSFTDTIYLKKDLIYFNDIIFYDEQKNEAKISGKVVHDYFSNFMYYIELYGHNFLLYNASQTMNPMFSGRVMASGTGSINGDEQNVSINAQLKTNANTRIRMNFMEDTVNEYSFITYKSVKTEQNTLKSVQSKPASNVLKTESGIDISMNIYVDATPDAAVEIVMDPVGGDVLKCNGSGALQFVWGTKSSPRLYGTYEIISGSYNFTFQKIVERKFVIESGSNVMFRGDPFQANMDVAAIYKLSANLNDLDAKLAEETGQATVPVECILKITGDLRSPLVKLDVALPTADPEVQRQVKNLMNNEDIVNRQMVYLLILSKFYTPNNTDDTNKSSDFASFASATLSTQLSKMLSTIDDKWQFGTNIRTNDGGFTRTEVELLLSSQLLNNRLLINGNFGYRDDSKSQIQNALITDIDIEYLLNQAGTWRIKVYNHFNEKYYYKNSDKPTIQTQGIGILYKRNFDYWPEIFGMKPQYKIQFRNDSIGPVLPDAAIKGSNLGDFIKIKDDGAENTAIH